MHSIFTVISFVKTNASNFLLSKEKKNEYQEPKWDIYQFEWKV